MVTPQSPNPTAFPTEHPSLASPEPVPLTPQDLVPHLRSLARSLREGSGTRGNSTP